MLPLVWGDVSPRVVFRKHKQLSLSPDTHNTAIIIFLHDKLLQVSKLPLSYVSLDSEFTRIGFFCFIFFVLWIISIGLRRLNSRICCITLEFRLS